MNIPEHIEAITIPQLHAMLQATVDLGHWIRSELDTQTGSSLSPSPARN